MAQCERYEKEQSGQVIGEKSRESIRIWWRATADRRKNYKYLLRVKTKIKNTKTSLRGMSYEVEPSSSAGLATHNPFCVAVREEQETNR